MSEKEEAIDRVERGAPELWKKTALKAVKWRAKKGVPFTTDEVWSDLEGAGVEPPREPRAMGAIMRKAVSEGVIVATDKTKISRKGTNNKRPVRVWSPLTAIKQKVCDCCGTALPEDLEFHQFHSIQESSVLCIGCYEAWKEYKDFLLEKVAEQRARLEQRNNVDTTKPCAEDE